MLQFMSLLKIDPCQQKETVKYVNRKISCTHICGIFQQIISTHTHLNVLS